MNNNSGGNRFFDGFLWGLIIGGGLVFLFGTKRGKRIIKMISEEGFENISELLENQIDKEEDLEDEMGDEMASSGNGVTNPMRPESNSIPQNLEEEKKPQSFRRRFFRRKS